MRINQVNINVFVAFPSFSVFLRQDKSGMENIDADRVNQVIYEASKGSKYFENVRDSGALFLNFFFFSASKSACV